MRYKQGVVLKRRIYSIYHHMGIYAGHGAVYHFHKSGKDISIVRTSLKSFANGKKVSVHCEPRDAAHAKAILQRAREAYRNDSWTNRYSVVLRNCEDFCAYCYGKGQYRRLSQRGKTVVVMATIIGSVIAGKKISSEKNYRRHG